MFAWPPLSRGDDEIADVPVGVIGDEVLYMAKVAIGGVDVIPIHRDDAAQMWIAVAGMGLHARRLTRRGFGKNRRPRRRRDDGVGPEIRGSPRWIPPIVVVELGLHLLRHRLMFVRLWASLDLLLGQPDGQDQCFAQLIIGNMRFSGRARSSGAITEGWIKIWRPGNQ